MPHRTDDTHKIRRYAAICAVFWTLLLSGSFADYIVGNRRVVLEVGRSMALTSFEMDVLFRRWAARHGGVYVPETTVTPANPHLAGIPERDIAAASGRHLTLLNPACMIRQIFEQAREQVDLPQGHITSLKPIRAENAADPWEKQALAALENGAKEVVETVQQDGKPYLLFMRPLVTEKPCLKCHAAQGYKEGDVRGGISIKLSLAPIQKAFSNQMSQAALIHLFIWLLGLGFIWFGTRKIIRTMVLLRNERSRLSESEEQLHDRNDDLQSSEETLRVQIEEYETSQKHLKMSEKKFAALLDNTKVQLWAFDGTSYTYMNREWFDFTGQKPDSPPTLERWASVVHPDDLDASNKIWAANWETKTEHDNYFRLRRQDGVYRDFYSHAVPIMNEDGVFQYFQGFNIDITERKRAREERELLEQQFHHAQKLESLGVLAGGIAHDFNNILTIIMGHCYMAREHVLSEEEHRASFQQIENAGNRAADICRQMLTYAGKSPLVQTRVNLWRIVDEVIKMLQAAIKKNVTIELDLNQRIPEIRGDSGQIQQIVMNLIINAAEAIGDAHGTIRIVLTTTVIADDQTGTDAFGTIICAGRYARLAVSDDGCGMDEETQKRIFEPFYTTKFTGRGLGMSAIHGIVTSHKAVLQLTSSPGVGTTFRICFPLLELSDVVETNSEKTTLHEKSGGTVLLVDDEQNLRDPGALLLKTMGLSTLTAQDGREALEIYRKHASEIDVILLDLIMPVMGGIEAYHELRKIAPTVPIIICSGYGIESVEDIINIDQYADFVHKPYNPEGLRIVMVKMTGQHLY